MLTPLLLSFLLAGADLSGPTASEAVIDAFIAALPPSTESADKGPSEIDKQALEQLEQRNPGREAEAAKVFAQYRQCKATARQQGVAEALRSSARRLGDEKLQRLTAFYSGPNFALFRRLSNSDGESLSEAEKAELERIMAAYPLHDYFQSSKQTEQEMWSADGLMGELIKCEEALEAELAEQGLEA